MPARRRLLWACLVLSAGLLAFALGTTQVPVDSSSPPPTSIPAPASAPLVAHITVPAPAPPAPLELPGPPLQTVNGHRTPPGPPVVRARLGQRVELAVTPPQPDAVSITGFDRIRPGSPTTPARFALVAHRSGRFPLVLESSGQTVGVLEIAVDPRRPTRHGAPAP